MFGHQDHDDPTNTDNQSAPQQAADPQADAMLTGSDTGTAATTSAPAISEDVAGDYIATPHTAPTAATDSSAVSSPSSVAGDDLSAPASAAPDTNGLLDLKQDALQKLSPLLGHLDQTPEEKFRTTMMMIQASDNQALLKDAYEAAQGIEDEKTRAQALLDVVNEINYFTQNNSPDQQ